MKTRIIASLAAAIMALQPALAQDRASCERIVELTYEAIKPHLFHLETDTLMGANQDYALATSGEVDAMLIGGRTFSNTHTVIGDIAHLNEGYRVKLDGLIGYEVLSKQPTLLSFANEKMVFIGAESLAGAGLKP